VAEPVVPKRGSPASNHNASGHKKRVRGGSADSPQDHRFLDRRLDVISEMTWVAVEQSRGIKCARGGTGACRKRGIDHALREARLAVEVCLRMLTVILVFVLGDQFDRFPRRTRVEQDGPTHGRRSVRCKPE
jgi:hypothetical protein